MTAFCFESVNHDVAIPKPYLNFCIRSLYQWLSGLIIINFSWKDRRTGDCSQLFTRNRRSRVATSLGDIGHWHDQCSRVFCAKCKQAQSDKLSRKTALVLDTKRQISLKRRPWNEFSFSFMFLFLFFFFFNSSPPKGHIVQDMKNGLGLFLSPSNPLNVFWRR